jgi:hypothetical protein
LRHHQANGCGLGLGFAAASPGRPRGPLLRLPDALDSASSLFAWLRVFAPAAPALFRGQRRCGFRQPSRCADLSLPDWHSPGFAPASPAPVVAASAGSCLGSQCVRSLTGAGFLLFTRSTALSQFFFLAADQARPGGALLPHGGPVRRRQSAMWPDGPLGAGTSCDSALGATLLALVTAHKGALLAHFHLDRARLAGGIACLISVVDFLTSVIFLRSD